jgi:hypothetical protein
MDKHLRPISLLMLGEIPIIMVNSLLLTENKQSDALNIIILKAITLLIILGMVDYILIKISSSITKNTALISSNLALFLFPSIFYGVSQIIILLFPIHKLFNYREVPPYLFEDGKGHSIMIEGSFEWEITSFILFLVTFFTVAYGLSYAIEHVRKKPLI